MNKRQYEQAVRLLKADCQITGSLLDDAGQTCAVGCLALAAGVSPRTLKRQGGAIDSCTQAGIVKAIRKKFGLELETLCNIQHHNDCNSDRKHRVKMVVLQVRNAYKEGKR